MRFLANAFPDTVKEDQHAGTPEMYRNHRGTPGSSHERNPDSRCIERGMPARRGMLREEPPRLTPGRR